MHHDLHQSHHSLTRHERHQQYYHIISLASLHLFIVFFPSFCGAGIPQSSGKGDSKIFTAPRINVNIQNLDSNGVNEACQKGLKEVSDTGNLEQNLIRYD